jgi:signal transduction histidine kinase
MRPGVDLPRAAAYAVLTISVLLAVVEVGRVGLAGSTADVVVAVIATVLLLPLHVWHLRHGLRGERPPGSHRTLAVMAVVHAAALWWIGPIWCYMLAMLATSALIVLRPPWSWAVLAGCATAPLVLLNVDLGGPAFWLTWGLQWQYLSYSVVFRCSILFALIWLVAAAHQLAISRSALADEAVEGERRRVESEVRESLERHMQTLAPAASRARAAVAYPDVEVPLAALRDTVALSREALVDLRTIIAEARRTPADADAASRALAGVARGRKTPIGLGLVTRRAWVVCGAVHALVLLFPLLSASGAFGGDADIDLVVLAVLWAAVALLQIGISLDVAHGRQPHFGVLRWAGLVIVAGTGLSLFGLVFTSMMWVVGTSAIMCFRGRIRMLVLGAVVVAQLVYEIAFSPYLDFGENAYLAGWEISYFAVIIALSTAGLYASARLVEAVAALDRTQVQLAERAVRVERRRLSADLHDLLGQTLTAISLKGDLAGKLIQRDRAAAAAEIDSLAELAASQLAEVALVTRRERTVVFETEMQTAIALLATAGVDVRSAIEVDHLEPGTSVMLGWVIREGVTNVLRHARASYCSIRAARCDGQVELELINDGASGRGDRDTGSGLFGLSERLSHARGVVHSGALGNGRYRLHVVIPDGQST